MYNEFNEILLVGFGNLEILRREFESAFPCRITSAADAESGLSNAASPVFVQPVYMLSGTEYEKLCTQVDESGANAVVGQPLLYSENALYELADILIREYKNKNVLFAGHGSAHPSGVLYRRLCDLLHSLGARNMHIGVLEGRPEFETVVSQIEDKEICLAPLTLSAGKHVRRDIFGERPESWESRLRAKGFSVTPVLRPLLEIPDVRRMFAESCTATMKCPPHSRGPQECLADKS